MINVRQVKNSDIPNLSILASKTYIDAFGPNMSTAELQDQLENYRSEKYFRQAIDDDTILLATENNLLVGYVQFGRIKMDIKDIEATTHEDRELGRLYVLSDFQGKGIGTLLIEAALAHPDMIGAKNIYLDVWEKNLGAQKLYKKHNFKVIGKNDYVFDNRSVGSDLIMVRRNLSR